MKATMTRSLVLKPGLDDFESEGFESPGFSSGDSLRVTVVSTTREGTKAALTLADTLAKNLGLRIRLLAVHAVPFHFPLEKPPVSLDFLERNQMYVVAETQVHPDELSIEIFLCRNQKQCLRQVLRPGSLVVVGGTKRHWRNDARKLERWLASEGHHVVFAEVTSRGRAPQSSRPSSMSGRTKKLWVRVVSRFAGSAHAPDTSRSRPWRLAKISSNRSVL
jgi:hypothetical protein